MYVREIMSTHVIPLNHTMTFIDAAKLFLAYRTSGAPVVNDDQELVGILSEKDLMRAMYPSYHSFYTDPRYYLHENEIEEAAEMAKNKQVKDIMSSRVVTTTPDTHILKIGGKMVATGIHRVPVIDAEKKLVGIVSRRDVYRALLEEKFHIHAMPVH